MRFAVIVLCLATFLAGASRVSAAQELSTEALKAVTGGIPCFDSDHFCVCDVYISDCCSNSGCPYFEGRWVLYTPDDYWKCSNGGVWAAILGVGLLVADVLLPVPSSLVMVAHGAAFDVLKGTLLSLAGSTGAAMCGFWLGRRGGRLLERCVPTEERARAELLGTRDIVAPNPVVDGGADLAGGEIRDRAHGPGNP